MFSRSRRPSTISSPTPLWCSRVRLPRSPRSSPGSALLSQPKAAIVPDPPALARLAPATTPTAPASTSARSRYRRRLFQSRPTQRKLPVPRCCGSKFPPRERPWRSGRSSRPTTPPLSATSAPSLRSSHGIRRARAGSRWKPGPR